MDRCVSKRMSHQARLIDMHKKFGRGKRCDYIEVFIRCDYIGGDYMGG